MKSFAMLSRDPDRNLEELSIKRASQPLKSLTANTKFV
jgi:hypothetical protein